MGHRPQARQAAPVATAGVLHAIVFLFVTVFPIPFVAVSVVSLPILPISVSLITVAFCISVFPIAIILLPLKPLSVLFIAILLLPFVPFTFIQILPIPDQFLVGREGDGGSESWMLRLQRQ